MSRTIHRLDRSLSGLATPSQAARTLELPIYFNGAQTELLFRLGSGPSTPKCPRELLDGYTSPSDQRNVPRANASRPS